MTRLMEPYRVEQTLRVTHVGRSVTIPGAWVLADANTLTPFFARGVPRVLTAMFAAHGALDVKVRRFENTHFVETILSIRKAI